MSTEENNTNKEQKKEVFKHEQGEITVNLNSAKEKAKETGKTIGEKAKKISAVVKEVVVRRKKIIIPVAVILVVGIAAAAYGITHLGYRGKLNECVRVVNSREVSVDKIAEAVLSDTAYDNYAALVEIIGEVDYIEGELDYIEEKIDDFYVKLDDNFGSNAKVSIKILNCEKMSSSQLRKSERSYKEYYEDYLEYGVNKIDEYEYEDIASLAEKYGLTSSELMEARDYIDLIADDLSDMDITKGYNLDLELSIKGSRDSYRTKISMSMIKANGDWMIDYTSISKIKSIVNRILGEASDILRYL